MFMMQTKKDIKPGSVQWEAICQQCGRCCYEKLDYHGKIIYTNQPCVHLDTTINRCRIYADRSALNPECAQLTPELIAAGILPADCPYVAGLVDYKAPELVED